VLLIQLRLRIIAYKTLREFGDDNAPVKSSVDAWYKVVKSRNMIWKKPQDVVEAFGATRTDILGNDRVCIDISGNDIRIILKVKYGHGLAFVRWIGWHKDYDKLTDINNI
jgi:mRNA interferase HigB